jgi:hypothetical protein
MWQAGRPWDVSTYLNVPADPEWTVWMTGVTKEEIYANGFNWVEVDNVTEPKWRVWNEIFWSGAMNPSKANVRAAIAEVIESLRGEITMSHAGPVSEIKWQQEGILQLISNTDAKCTLRHDAAGHTQVVIEVNEEACQAKFPSSRTPEPNRNKFNRDPEAGDDTLPLIVQRSV